MLVVHGLTPPRREGRLRASDAQITDGAFRFAGVTQSAQSRTCPVEPRLDGPHAHAEDTGCLCLAEAFDEPKREHLTLDLRQLLDACEKHLPEGLSRTSFDDLRLGIGERRVPTRPQPVHRGGVPCCRPPKTPQHVGSDAEDPRLDAALDDHSSGASAPTLEKRHGHRVFGVRHILQMSQAVAIDRSRAPVVQLSERVIVAGAQALLERDNPLRASVRPVSHKSHIGSGRPSLEPGGRPPGRILTPPLLSPGPAIAWRNREGIVVKRRRSLHTCCRGGATRERQWTSNMSPRAVCPHPATAPAHACAGSASP